MQDKTVLRGAVAGAALRSKTTLKSDYGFAALIFIAGLALNPTVYLPHFSEINYLDEIVYLSSGKNLIDGFWWPYSRGPMIAFVYAAIYPFANLFDNWLLASALIGRFLSYACFFGLAWLLGREMQHRRLAHPLAVVGIMTVLPPYLSIITNPSYAVFVIFSGFAFWAALWFGRTQSRRALFTGAGFVLGTLLVRPDVLMGALLVLVFIINKRPLRFSPTPFNKTLAGLAIILVAGMAYVIIAAPFKFSGNLKMYNTFEAAQQILADTSGMFDFDAAAVGKAESEKYFGTAEENNHSVFRAAARNPTRFFKLIWVNTVDRTLPMLQIAYGGRAETRPQIPYISWFIGFLGLAGLASLVQRGEGRVLLSSLLMPANLIVYLITITFPVYLQMPFLVVYMLAGIGFTAMLCLVPPLRARPLYALVPALALFMFVNTPQTLRFTWPGPQNDYEKQAAWLKDNFAPLTPVKSWPAYAPVLGKMSWVGIGLEVQSIKSQQDLRRVLESQDIKAVLVDPYLRTQNIYGWFTALERFGKGYLKPAWQSPDGQFQVLVPQKIAGAKP